MLCLISVFYVGPRKGFSQVNLQLQKVTFPAANLLVPILPNAQCVTANGPYNNTLTSNQSTIVLSADYYMMSGMYYSDHGYAI